MMKKKGTNSSAVFVYGMVFQRRLLCQRPQGRNWRSRSESAPPTVAFNIPTRARNSGAAHLRLKQILLAT